MTKQSLSLAPVPFVRIAVPFAIGILTFDLCPAAFAPFSILSIAAGCAVSMIFIRKSYRSNSWHYCFNAMAFCLVLAVGWWCASIRAVKPLPDNTISREMTFPCEVEEINQKDASTEVIGTATVASTQQRIKVSIVGNDYHLRIGDVIAIYSRIQRIENLPNSDFDYESFMSRQGIIYECNVDKGEYSLLKHNDNLAYRADCVKRRIIQLIRLSGIQSSSADLAIVFCTGDRRYMANEAKQAFSDSGVAHILAVSGLHIGIIICILSLLFYPMSHPRFRIFKSVLMLTGIWGYVFFTGLPTSAIRAAIMATFVIAAKDLLQKHSSVNAFAASAFFILLFSPEALFDVGFQLSFLSVLGILLWSAQIASITPAKNKILRYLLASISVTVAAQLATAPTVIHYFQSFPTGFFIANIFIIPVLPVFFFATIIAIALAAIGYKFGLLNITIDWLYNFISYVASISQTWLPAIKPIWISAATAIFATLTVFGFGISLRFKVVKAYHLLPAVLLSAFIISLFTEHSSRRSSQCFIAESYGATNLVVYRNECLYLLNSLNDTILCNEFLEHSSTFLAKKHIRSVIKPTTEINGNGFYLTYPFAYIDGKTYLFLKGNYKRLHKKGRPIKVDYAIFTRRFYNQIPDLPDYVIADTLVFPHEIYSSRRDTLINYAKRHRIPFKE